MNRVKQYKYVLLFLAGLLVLSIFWPETGRQAVTISIEDTLMILGILPPVLVLIGLLDVWLPREVVIRHMGDNSGIRGIGLAFILGSVAAGPLFIAFPIAAVLARKGARLANILFFIGAWSVTKLPMVLFEWSFFGGTFTTVHILVGLTVILIGSFVIERLAPESGLAQLKQMADRQNLKPFPKNSAGHAGQRADGAGSPE